MKTRCLLFVVCTLFLSRVQAATSIVTASLSGHFSIAGSPYNIYNNVSVDFGDSLVIDPGVQLIFQGAYSLNVNGTLVAVGSAAQPILFTLQDTTGFYIDTINSGGWQGISIASTNSQLSYCTFEFIKNYDISISTSMHISYCNFEYNKRSSAAITGGSGILLLYTPDTSVHMEVDHCNFTNNISSSGALFVVDNNSLGTAYIHDNNFSNNKIYGLGSLMLGSNAILNFDYNVVSQNGDSLSGGAAQILNVSGLYAYFNGNKIYSNTSSQFGPLYLTQGIYYVDNNYICNNRSLTTGICGFAYGGGAMFLEGYGTDTLTTNFTVRNNVIANNYCPYLGGGIYLNSGKAVITNNDIINNMSPQGSGVYLDFPTHVVLKNNIFLGNENDGLTDPESDAIYMRNNALAPMNLSYDHNWSDHAFYTGFQYLVGSVIDYASDTADNLVGTAPGIIASTGTAGYLESALTANFGLNSSSPCIDAGDTSGLFVTYFDFAGNNRISGTAIDIGAIEYGAGSFPLSVATSLTGETKVYPNPARFTVNVVTTGSNGSILLFDVTGQLVAQQSITGDLSVVDIHSFPSGIYLVAIKNATTTSIVSKLIID